MSRSAGVCAHRTRIEHVDTDASGIVHFSRFTSLAETTGLGYLEERGAGLVAFAGAGVDLVAVEVRVRYVASAAYRDPVLGFAHLDHVGVARFRLAVTLARDRPPAAPATLAVCRLLFGGVDPDTRRAVPLPTALHSALEGIARDDRAH